jgi:hypothetical protein
MTCCGQYQFSENGTDNKELTFVIDVANGSSEPRATDAAPRTIVRLLLAVVAGAQAAQRDWRDTQERCNQGMGKLGFEAWKCLAEPYESVGPSKGREAPLSFRFFGQCVSQNRVRPMPDRLSRDHQIRKQVRVDPDKRSIGRCRNGHKRDPLTCSRDIRRDNAGPHEEPDAYFFAVLVANRARQAPVQDDVLVPFGLSLLVRMGPPAQTHRCPMSCKAIHVSDVRQVRRLHQKSPQIHLGGPYQMIMWMSAFFGMGGRGQGGHK